MANGAKGHKETSAADKGPSDNKETPDSRTKEDQEEACRCKEVAKKTPVELLKLMLSDLVFWKKARPGKP